MDLSEFKQAMRELERHHRTMMADSLALLQCADDIVNGKTVADALSNMIVALNVGEENDE